MCIKSKDPYDSSKLAQKFHEAILKFLAVKIRLVPSEKKLLKTLGKKYAIIITRKVFTDMEYSKYIGLLIQSYMVIHALNIESSIETSKDNDSTKKDPNKKNSIKKDLAKKESTKKESKKNPKEEEPIKRNSIKKPPTKKNPKEKELTKKIAKKKQESQ